VLELYAGFKSRREEQNGERLLSEAKILPVTHDIAKRAGILSRIYASSHGLDDIDAIIAATAEQHGLRLATLNVKHFPMFPKLKRAY
jgi:predicted nucleic acid-binding protein